MGRGPSLGDDVFISGDAQHFVNAAWCGVRQLSRNEELISASA
jgi:hypothetical protein